MRPRPQLLLLLALLTLAHAGCVNLPLRNTWAQAPPVVDGMDRDWTQANEVLTDGLRIKAMNDAENLYLCISTDHRALQSQLSGRYGQALTFWFGTRPDGHGLRFDFSPRRDAQPSPDDREADPLGQVDSHVTLLGPAAEDLPRPWLDGSEGIEVVAHTHFGTMIYELKLPLRAHGEGCFALGVAPGDKVPLWVDASDSDHSFFRSKARGALLISQSLLILSRNPPVTR